VIRRKTIPIKIHIGIECFVACQDRACEVSTLEKLDCHPKAPEHLLHVYPVDDRKPFVLCKHKVTQHMFWIFGINTKHCVRAGQKSFTRDVVHPVKERLRHVSEG